MQIFNPLLIVVEGAKTPPKMLTHFHRVWADSRKLFSVLRASPSPEESEAAGTDFNSLA
ncbi:hypothetical protein V7201_11330 [Bacillus sp. JJ1122]